MKKPSRFPLLTYCFQNSTSSVGLFPIMKEWNQKKLRNLLDEIEHADDVSAGAYGEMVLRAENFLSPSRSRALDEQRLEFTLILSEIAAVALHYVDQKGVSSESAKGN